MGRVPTSENGSALRCNDTDVDSVSKTTIREHQLGKPPLTSSLDGSFPALSTNLRQGVKLDAYTSVVGKET